MVRFLRGLKNKSEDKTFWEHVEILRIYLIRSLLVIVIAAIAAFFFKDFIFGELMLGPSDPDFVTYHFFCFLGEWLNTPALCVKQIPMELINTDLGGQFRIHLVVSFVSGLIIAFPFMAWQLWLFVSPALHSAELKKARWLIFYIILLFFTGLLFGYYVILPLVVNFLAGYELSGEINNLITINSYISNVTTLPLILGLVFELPVLVYFLTSIGLLEPGFLKKTRKYSIVIILIIAGLITPSTDMFSQILVALPLYLLYEGSIAVSVRIARRQGQYPPAG